MRLAGSVLFALAFLAACGQSEPAPATGVNGLKTPDAAQPAPESQEPARRSYCAPAAAQAPTQHAEPVAAAPAAPVLDAAGLARALPALERNEGAAWQTLGPRGGLEPAAATDALADPCPRWAQQNVQCFKSSRTSLAQIRLLNRPGVLTLVDANGRNSFVTLTGLSDSHAEVALNGVPHHVPLDVLAGVWRGDFATLWRSAPGYPGPRGVASSAPVASTVWMWASCSP